MGLGCDWAVPRRPGPLMNSVSMLRTWFASSGPFPCQRPSLDAPSHFIFDLFLSHCKLPFATQNCSPTLFPASCVVCSLQGFQEVATTSTQRRPQRGSMEPLQLNWMCGTSLWTCDMFRNKYARKSFSKVS